MKNGIWHRRISQITLALSVVCFAVTVYITSNWNREPVMLPLPGPNSEVASTFTITTGGQFRLQVTLPGDQNMLDKASMHLQPPLRCRLDLKLDGDNNFKVAIKIDELLHSETISSQKVDIYTSEGLNIPQGGEYAFTLFNTGCASHSTFKGGLAVLTRYDHPSERFIATVLVRQLGWVFFMTGLSFSILSELGQRSRSKAR